MIYSDISCVALIFAGYWTFNQTALAVSVINKSVYTYIYTNIHDVLDLGNENTVTEHQYVKNTPSWTQKIL